MVFLKKLGHSQVDLPRSSKQSFSAEGSLALQRPHVDLLLAVGKGAVPWVPALLLSSHISKDSIKQSTAFTQLYLEIHHKTSTISVSNIFNKEVAESCCKFVNLNLTEAKYYAG